MLERTRFRHRRAPGLACVLRAEIGWLCAMLAVLGGLCVCRLASAETALEVLNDKRTFSIVGENILLFRVRSGTASSLEVTSLELTNTLVSPAAVEVKGPRPPAKDGGYPAGSIVSFDVAIKAERRAEFPAGSYGWSARIDARDEAGAELTPLVVSATFVRPELKPWWGRNHRGSESCATIRLEK